VALRVWELAIDSTGGYVYSRVLLAACSAVATTLFLALAGVPYPLAVGLWVGLISQFIPTVGTYLAGALPAAASVQALVSIYLHRYEVIADPLTRTPNPARRAP